MAIMASGLRSLVEVVAHFLPW